MRSAAVAAAVVCVACSRSEQAAAPPTDTLRIADSAAIGVTHEQRYELTGDSVPELVRVQARGPRSDSLDVRFEIRSASGDALYVDRWTSRLYFVYIDRGDFSDAQADSIVFEHLRRIVRDSSYYDPRRGTNRRMLFTVEPEHVSYSMAERAWRDARSLPDTAELPPAAHSEIDARTVPPERVSSLVAELERQPAFTYFAGGEANYTIAWSPSRRRFFTIWSCC